ncbi:helix-turn-helix transcriptional regulator [Nanchangia anserum]|uniref:Helix-turn-helix transcriptional regulator n=1 Tax=Nanchangia anserum TaxID=2692125 RepID=A0A8I0KRA7_9ACTO|nr:helix-turn-helix transcriptional regulator [Nanchangia anserum]MBD3689242.1 helix-turn-helix transcriptional regulator [Nanchangia anserum]QOX81464.1 helix-turn-helix transcriptional regulator [Nanchangia anserum]
MIACRIDVLLAERGMGVGECAERVGISPANLAVLKNGRAKAIRFTTLEALCRVLECQPGDLLRYVDNEAASSIPPSPTTTSRSMPASR